MTVSHPPTTSGIAFATMLIAAYAVLLSAIALAIHDISPLQRGIAFGFVGSALLAVSAGLAFNHSAGDVAVLTGAGALAVAVGARLLAKPAAELDSSHLRTLGSSPPPAVPGKRSQSTRPP